MKTSDWDNLELRALGRKWAAEAYDLASELHNLEASSVVLMILPGARSRAIFVSV